MNINMNISRNPQDKAKVRHPIHKKKFRKGRKKVQVVVNGMSTRR